METSLPVNKLNEFFRLFAIVMLITIYLFIFTYLLSIFAKMKNYDETLTIICGYSIMFIFIDILCNNCHENNDLNPEIDTELDNRS